MVEAPGFRAKGSRVGVHGYGFRDQQFRRLAQRRPSWGLGLVTCGAGTHTVVDGHCL